MRPRILTRTTGIVLLLTAVILCSCLALDAGYLSEVIVVQAQGQDTPLQLPVWEVPPAYHEILRNIITDKPSLTADTLKNASAMFSIPELQPSTMRVMLTAALDTVDVSAGGGELVPYLEIQLGPEQVFVHVSILTEGRVTDSHGHVLPTGTRLVVSPAGATPQVLSVPPESGGSWVVLATTNPDTGEAGGHLALLVDTGQGYFSVGGWGVLSPEGIVGVAPPLAEDLWSVDGARFWTDQPPVVASDADYVLISRRVNGIFEYAQEQAAVEPRPAKDILFAEAPFSHEPILQSPSYRIFLSDSFRDVYDIESITYTHTGTNPLEIAFNRVLDELPPHFGNNRHEPIELAGTNWESNGPVRSKKAIKGIINSVDQYMVTKEEFEAISEQIQYSTTPYTEQGVYSPSNPHHIAFFEGNILILISRSLKQIEDYSPEMEFIYNTVANFWVFMLQAQGVQITNTPLGPDYSVYDPFNANPLIIVFSE